MQYFFITDIFGNGGVSEVWCLTGDIIGDYITKPFQCSMFRKFWYQIMGVITAADPGPVKVKVEQLIKL